MEQGGRRAAAGQTLASGTGRAPASSLPSARRPGTLYKQRFANEMAEPNEDNRN